MERIKQIACGLLAVLLTTASTAQNNSIFKGGTADGWTSRNSSQANSNVYKGGNGDGWSSANFAQASSSIFKGGFGDGWDAKNYLQTSTGIFKGGFGDGWDAKGYLQRSTGIYKGGGGDGWASTYRPLGILPVTFISFTAEKKSATGLLQWETAKEDKAAGFDVERSADAVNFTALGTVAASGNATAGASYHYVDAQPLHGYNYYRLKQIDLNGAFVYTPTRLLLFDATFLQSIKAYPVPATSSLTVELPVQIQAEDAVINVSNALGVTVQQIKLFRNRATNRTVLNLGRLPAGAYTLQLSSVSFKGSQVIVKQ